jgi:hypothetical protein
MGYRLQTVAQNFTGGGRLVDYSAQGQFMLRHDLSVSGSVQYEQWRFPVLNLIQQSDFTASLQLTYFPRWRVGK